MKTSPHHPGPHLPRSALERLPIFPLPNVVLFPGVTLPLRVFEPRYVAMFEACTREDNAMAVCLLGPGWEADYGGRPEVYETACAGLIVASERHADGSYDFLLYGVERVRILGELDTDEPFRRVHAEPVVEFISDDDDAAAERLRRVALQIADSVEGAGQLLGSVLGAARSPGHLADLISAHVLDPVELRQECLEIESVHSRLERASDALGAALLHLVAEPEPGDLH